MLEELEAVEESFAAALLGTGEAGHVGLPRPFPCMCSHVRAPAGVGGTLPGGLGRR